MKKSYTKLFETKGFTLIEAMVSAFIVATVVLGPLTVAIDASSNARLTKNTITASFLSQEGIELLRTLQDSLYIKCTQGSSICPIASNQTTGDAAWLLFKSYLSYPNHSGSASCFKNEGGCAYDYIGATQYLNDPADASPVFYTLIDPSCMMLSLGSDGMYACSGATGSSAGYGPGKYSRKVYIESLATTNGTDSGSNDDLRVTSQVTFVRPFGTTKTVTLVDFLHARP